MATHFLKLNTGRVREENKTPLRSLMHIWVIGDHDWLKKPITHSDIIQGIHEEETADNYRIFLIGHLMNQRYGRGGWRDHLRYAGMKKKKKHNDPVEFEECSDVLLGLMLRHYRKFKEAPSIILDGLGVPYVFLGNS